jgi:tetratricopeptide (TPR) repeat protein
MVLPLDNLGIVAQYHGEYETARRYQDEALGICRAYGYENGLAHVLENMGSRAVQEGNYALAREYYGELLPLLQQQNYHHVIIGCLEGIATLGFKLGLPIEAARLWGAAEQLRENNKSPMSSLYVAHHQQEVAAALEQSGSATFLSAWSEGRAMLTQVALARAVAMLGDVPA